MNTVRPIKRVDAAASHRNSTDFIRTVSQCQRQHAPSPVSQASSSKESLVSSAGETDEGASDVTPDTSAASLAPPLEEGVKKLGRTVVRDVVGPAIDSLCAPQRQKKGSQDSVEEKDMSAAELESLTMIKKGFDELAASRPELAWRLVEGVLSGVNECVATWISRFLSLTRIPSQQLEHPFFTSSRLSFTRISLRLIHSLSRHRRAQLAHLDSARSRSPSLDTRSPRTSRAR